MMRKTFFFLLAALVLLGMTACSDENEPARTPVASATISQTDLEVNQSMQITFNGVADQVVVYTGDEGHNFALRDSSDTGFPVNKGLFTYSYSLPGNYHVVVVASTYDTYLGDGLRQDTTTFDVKVTDDVTELENVYSSITPNIYYAELLDNNAWVLRLPTKQVYNNRDVTLRADRQRLSFDIASGATNIYIDGDLWQQRNYYDLTKTHDIHVVANSGATRDYKLYTLIYPELTSVSVNGVKGTLKRDPFDQSAQTYNFKLPAGSNLANATITFSVNEDARFLVKGQEVTSGSTVDLTSGNITLVTTSPENKEVSATSHLTFLTE